MLGQMNHRVWFRGRIIRVHDITVGVRFHPSEITVVIVLKWFDHVS